MTAGWWVEWRAEYLAECLVAWMADPKDVQKAGLKAGSMVDRKVVKKAATSAERWAGLTAVQRVDLWAE